jgi:hypothetical protein
MLGQHHKFLGEDGIDTDLPSRIEALVLSNVFGKAFFWCVALHLLPSAPSTNL